MGTLVVWTMYLVLVYMLSYSTNIAHWIGPDHWMVSSIGHIPWYVTQCQGVIRNVPDAFFAAFSPTWCTTFNGCWLESFGMCDKHFKINQYCY